MSMTFPTKFMKHSMLLALVLSMGWLATPSKAILICATPTPITPLEVAPGDCSGPLNPVGTLVSPVLTTPFSLSTGTASGSLTTAVFQEAGGTLDFYYQITNNAGSKDSIARNTDVDFTGFSTSTAFRTDCGTVGCAAGFVNGTVAPFDADRKTSITVGFDFVNNPFFGTTTIGAGSTSNVLIIQTDATAFTNGFASVIDGGVATVAAFQPLAAVPEPVSLTLLGTALLCLGLLRRKTA